MKTINPFKRLNKEDFIPCSLFPASKVCDTSMDIGRATPLYCLDMVAGNRVSLDLSQLTRFQPMIAPVMTNYSIEYGAFFVPYVAFDEFFQSTWFRTHCQNTDVQRKAVLRAREFFNPAIDNSEKVHPWNFSTKRCGDKVAWVGSLYDHLRAPLGLPDWSEDKIYSSGGSSVDDTNDVTEWLDKDVVAGSTSLGKISKLFSNNNSIYPYLQTGAYGVWSINGSNISQLLLAATHSGAVKDSTSLGKLQNFFDNVSAVNLYDTSATNVAETMTYQYYYQNSKNYDWSYISGVDLPTFRAGSFVVALSYVDTLTKVAKNSGTAATPYRVYCTSYVDTFDVDKLYKWWYKEATGKDVNGTFSYDAVDDAVSYASSSASTQDSNLGVTVLSSLLDSSVYSQMLPLADDSSTDVPLLSMTSEVSGEFLGFVLWIAKQYNLLSSNKTFSDIINSASPTASLITFFALWKSASASLTVDQKQFARVMASLLSHFYGVIPSTKTIELAGDVMPYSDLLGKTTIVSVQGAYRSYVENLWISTNRDLQWNSVYWLAYQRIFADWFLNEHYTKHEDYLDLVGSAYIAGAQSLQNRDGKTMTDWFTAGELSDGNNPKLLEDPTLSYFGDRIARGECMPVLWSLDCVTNLRQSTSTSSTPIGQSITENFYNRFYARFKDLINRMGPDYRRNARALYGKGPDDASLLRSQVVGYKSFDMQIGDVAQNSESTKDSTLGQFAGYAVSRNRAGSFDWTAQESGVFVVLAWVRPKYTCFADLVPRSLYKSEYMDYLIPQFGGVGYQDFAYKQLNPTDANPDSRLGYEERYSEYMMMDNECSGLMRTSMAYYNSNRIGTPCYTPNTADFYHLLYMDEESDLKRVFVDNFNDPVLVSAYFNGNVTRQLPATIKTEF